MVTELLVPERRLIVPRLPSYVKLGLAFSLGEGTTLFDKSRYRSHGTISGADWVAGLHGPALDFVAASIDYVLIPADYTQLNFTSESFSIVMRVYFDDLTINNTLLMRGAQNARGYNWAVRPGGYVHFYTSQSGANQDTYSSSAAVATGAWYTVGMSRVGALVKLYVNGVDKTEVGATHIDPTTCNDNAAIGVRSDLSTWPFDGKIEFVRIFGGLALTTSEHLAWHNALA